MTEGYNSAGAEGEDEGDGDSEVNVSNVAPELLRLVKFQVELFSLSFAPVVTRICDHVFVFRFVLARVFVPGPSHR